MHGIRGGGQAGGTPLPPPPPTGKSQNCRFLSNTRRDPLENRKTTKPGFDVGPLSTASVTPFKWRFAGGPMMARFKWYLNWVLSPELAKNRFDPF